MTLSVVSTLVLIALAAAGMLSVLLYPTLARALLQRAGQRTHVPGLGFHPVSG